jgi:MoaA/NifB/PqqE/SkfB family radical SAM enzyme
MFDTLTTNALTQLNVVTHRTFALPLLVFYVTARCNSRCVSCDWWKSDGAADLTLDEIRDLAAELPALRTRLVVFSGGEPLLRRDVFEMADVFRAHGVRLHLLTSGLFLERDAEQVAARFEEVTLSLDGHNRDLYRQIRGVDGLELIERGVRKLKACAPQLPVRARSTLHRHNFRELPHLIDKAKSLELAQISFLAADVTSEAFGRRSETTTRGLLLTEDEVEEFARVVEETLLSHAQDFEARFVAESPEKLRRLPRYYAAQLGRGPFPPVACNAPWVSAVVEADGTVRPCYFHPAVGNIRQKPLRQILQQEMRAFRSNLDVSNNATCARCVCSLRMGLRTRLW